MLTSQLGLICKRNDMWSASKIIQYYYVKYTRVSILWLNFLLHIILVVTKQNSLCKFEDLLMFRRMPITVYALVPRFVHQVKGNWLCEIFPGLACPINVLYMSAGNRWFQFLITKYECQHWLQCFSLSQQTLPKILVILISVHIHYNKITTFTIYRSLIPELHQMHLLPPV